MHAITGSVLWLHSALLLCPCSSPSPFLFRVRVHCSTVRVGATVGIRVQYRVPEFSVRLKEMAPPHLPALDLRLHHLQGAILGRSPQLS